MELILLGLLLCGWLGGDNKNSSKKNCVIRLPSAGIVSDVKGSVTGRMLTGGL